MTDKSLVVRNDIPLQALGEILARSGFFQDTRDAAQAVVKVLAGQELGIGPVASMTGIYIVKGKVALSANLMGAAVKRSGRYNYRVHALTDAECDIEFFENGQSVGRSRFTMQDAQKAGLMSSDNWKRYPRNMLFARAMSNGVKWYCPDVTAGPAYTPDELGALEDDEGNIIEYPAPAPDEQPGPAPAPAPAPRNGGNGDGFDPATSADPFKASVWEKISAQLIANGVATNKEHAAGKLRKSLHAAGLIEAEDAAWPTLYALAISAADVWALIMGRELAKAHKDDGEPATPAMCLNCGVEPAVETPLGTEFCETCARRMSK